MAELSPVLAELERLTPIAADEFDLNYVAKVPPIINLASRGRARTQVGWYTPGVWSDTFEDTLAFLGGTAEAKDQVKRAELTIATELLVDPVSTVSELLRLLKVHQLVTMRSGNRDAVFTEAGYYPIAWESGWARQMSHQATVLPDQPSRGWAQWTPMPNAVDWINGVMNKAPFDISREGVVQAARKGSRMKKWTCGCTTIRCATRVVGHCDVCGESFAWAERSEPNPWATTEGGY